MSMDGETEVGETDSSTIPSLFIITTVLVLLLNPKLIIVVLDV